MGFFDAIGDLAGDVVDVATDVVDVVVDVGEDIVDAAEDVVDAAMDTVEDIVDTAEDVVDTVLDTAEIFLDTVDDLLESALDEMGDILDSIEEIADEILDEIEDSWEWLEDSLDSAVDWLITASETVFEFIVEDAIPYLVAVAEFIPAVLAAIGALLVLPFCLLFKELFGDEEATILEGVSNHEPRLLDEFNVERLPINKKYVVFSDIHMYVDGDLNFYNKNGNSKIYQYALEQYAKTNFHLIENGDVEDFWMRDGSSKGLILSTSALLPWPYFSGAFESSSFQSANQVHAINMLSNNIKTYSTIRTLFHDNNHNYTRLIGNHDDVWSDAVMEPIMDAIYPGIVVNDYCTLENSRSNKTEVIISHGHQSDMFNMSMCSFAGKAITKLASILNELSFGKLNLFTKPKEDWMKEFSGKGFENELQQMDLLEGTSFSEYSLYKDLEEIYGDSSTQPHLILGHTHNPKDNALIPYYMYKDEWNWDEYSNSGTVGMWEEIVIGLEVEYPNINVVAWKIEQDGTIKKYVLKSYMYGDMYLKA